MTRATRTTLIKRIEETRGSRLLIYVLGDRQNMGTKISTDVFPFFINLLRTMGYQNNIDLFLYSVGGVPTAGYALVNTIREYCRRFGVIVPFKALSTATLIALGANDIIMEKMGLLSPIDPSIESPFGPKAPVPGQLGEEANIPVSVEDVMGYLKLAIDELKITDEDLKVRVFDRLAQSVHPLTLGHVNRIREQISFLASTLLSYHISDKDKIGHIVNTLYHGRFSHDYLLSRKEAKDIVGLPIIDVSDELDSAIVDLYSEYDRMLELSVPFFPDTAMGDRDEARVTTDRAIIESSDRTFIFRTVNDFKRVQLGPPQVPMPMIVPVGRMTSMNWQEDNNI